MSAGLKLGVDRFPIYNDVKNTSGPFLELRIHAKLFFDFRCETRSARQVISLTTVLDQDIHGALPFDYS